MKGEKGKLRGVSEQTKSTMMDSTMDAAAASDTAISPRLCWATLREPPPRSLGGW